MTTPVTDRMAARGGPRPPGWPFSAGDELSCYLDTPSEPNNVHLEAWVPGHLSPAGLRAAAVAALADAPLARVRRVGVRWWRAGYAWETPARPDLDPVSVVSWRTDTELDRARTSFLSAAPPLDRSPVFRLLLAQGPEWDSVILNAHHAAFDGRSCMTLLRLVADRYDAPGWGRPAAASGGGTAGPRSAALGRSCPLVVPAREMPGPGGSPAVSARPKRTRPRPVGWRTARIAPQRAVQGPADAPGYGFSLLEWPGTVAGSRSRGGPRVTVNDLLIAGLAETVTRWNTARHRRQRRVRISMPIDTRSPGQGGELGNLSRLATVAVDPPRTADLTAAVADRTRRAKSRPGPLVSPVLAFVVTAPLPAGVKRRLIRLALRGLGGIACDTTLLSNLGDIADPPRFGVLVPVRMWFSTSTHMPRGLSVGAITVGGRLLLCFRYRLALLDEAAGHAFAAEYARALSMLPVPAGRDGAR